jgi:mRNA-degrading endonuclease RelE of RelBE toxin-antitoxin system
MEVRVHPQVKRYLDESGEKERIKESLSKLAEDPFTSRSGADIKRLKGKSHDLYRLRGWRAQVRVLRRGRSRLGSEGFQKGQGVSFDPLVFSRQSSSENFGFGGRTHAIR